VKAVGLEAGAILRAPGEIAVAQEYRLRVPGRIVGCQVLRCGAAGGGHLEQIEVSRPGLGTPGDAGGEHHGVAVRAECIVAVVAVGLGGNVGIERLGQVDGDVGLAVNAQRGAEEVRAGAVAPGVPVAEK
jgi:hypothetical protein